MLEKSIFSIVTLKYKKNNAADAILCKPYVNNAMHFLYNNYK